MEKNSSIKEQKNYFISMKYGKWTKKNLLKKQEKKGKKRE